MRAHLLPIFVTLPLAATLVPRPAQSGPDCDSCKPAKAHWDWKANGYQLGDDADAAEAAATESGRKSACDKAEPYVAKNPVKCKAGCEPGEVTQKCEPREEPKCRKGTFDSDEGMWKFVCRKTRQGDKDAPSCDAARAKAAPGWSMCDVKVRAVKERACTAPGCD
jgi:hypothetical protein